MAKLLYITNKDTPLLTPAMIKTLLAAYEKEKKRLPIGPIDFKALGGKGSFSALLKKEYIGAKTKFIRGKKVVCWFLTTEALEQLNNFYLIKSN